MCLESGVFPRRWKGATITPLPKVEVISELGELRPLSLTSDLGLILESFVVEAVLTDIRPSIDHRQYGNLKGRSTSHYLIWIMDRLLRAIDQPNTFGSLTLIDFRKAFDFVDHSVVIAELVNMGCRASILPFICSFLTGRRHRVRYRGAISEWASITCGVPQGTRIGPIVFMALVNRISSDVEFRAKFVDDLVLLHLFRICLKDHLPILYPQQANLDTLSEQCTERGMVANPAKCEVLYPLLPQRQPLVLPDLQLCGEPLPVVESVKLLRVHINSQLTWETHVNYVTTKASKSIFILLRARKFGFSRDSILTLYIWYVRTWICSPGLVQRTHATITSSDWTSPETLCQDHSRSCIWRLWCSPRHPGDTVPTTASRRPDATVC